MDYTTNLNLPKPSDGNEPWGLYYRDAMDLLDSIIYAEHNADGTHAGRLEVTEAMLSAALAAKINAISDSVPLGGTVAGSEVFGDIVFDSCGIEPLVSGTGTVGSAAKHWANGYFDNITVSSWPNGTFEGEVSDASVVEGTAVRFGSDGLLYKARSNSESTLPCIGMVTAVNAGIATVRAWGYTEFTLGSVSFTPFSTLYVSESTSGALTHIPPAHGSGYLHQVVGFSVAVNKMIILINLQPVRV